MNNIKLSLLFLFFSLLLTGCTEVLVDFDEDFKTKAVTSDISLTGAKFGVFDVDGSKYTLIETSEIPNTVGTAYGWVMRLDTAKKSVKTKQIYALPIPPKEWSNPNGNIKSISPDRKVSETEIEMKLVDGIVYGIWTVIEGDPIGESSIAVFIDGAPAANFDFEVLPK